MHSTFGEALLAAEAVKTATRCDAIEVRSEPSLVTTPCAAIGVQFSASVPSAPSPDVLHISPAMKLVQQDKDATSCTTRSKKLVQQEKDATSCTTRSNGTRITSSSSRREQKVMGTSNNELLHSKAVTRNRTSKTRADGAMSLSETLTNVHVRFV
jgi:hypothetical protein